MRFRHEHLVEGPRPSDVLRDPSHEQLPLFCWAIAWLGALVTLAMAIQHWTQIGRAHPSKQRKYFITITAMPVIFAVSAAITAVFIRTAIVFECIQHIGEALALHAFNKLMLARIGGPDKTLAFFKNLGRRRFYQVPPCCCCLCCLPPIEFNERMLELVKDLTRQFVVTVPVLAVLVVVVAYARLPEGYVWTGSGIRFVLMLSALAALWALFITWNATRVNLKDFNTGLKFLAIKLIIFLGLVQNFVIETLASSGAFSHTRMYGYSARAKLVHSALLAFESPLLYLLVMRAFPASELDGITDHEGEKIDVEFAGSSYGTATL